MKWSEAQIGRWLAFQTFNRKCLLVVPNCIWTGYEADLFCVTENLRIIDVEIKISRADLRADFEKAKWYHSWDWKIDGPRTWTDKDKPRRREWPEQVWKHYYCMPAEIWSSDLLDKISPVSGVLLLKPDSHGDLRIRCERPAKPNRKAEQITAEQAIDIARLASLRMWDAKIKVENNRRPVVMAAASDGASEG